MRREAGARLILAGEERINRPILAEEGHISHHIPAGEERINHPILVGGHRINHPIIMGEGGITLIILTGEGGIILTGEEDIILTITIMEVVITRIVLMECGDITHGGRGSPSLPPCRCTTRPYG
ncbi:MAG: hypothetical protein HGA40_03695 [Methanoregulaceae archaeon]|nr:hypothetical protein [Methanoregulaceae archaeon]